MYVRPEILILNGIYHRGHFDTYLNDRREIVCMKSFVKLTRFFKLPLNGIKTSSYFYFCLSSNRKVFRLNTLGPFKNKMTFEFFMCVMMLLINAVQYYHECVIIFQNVCLTLLCILPLLALLTMWWEVGEIIS